MTGQQQTVERLIAAQVAVDHRARITEALALIFKGIAQLKSAFPDKAFTIDGKLVGDIGEMIAALEYDVTLYRMQTAVHDGETAAGRKVQIKATFKDKLTMTAVPDLYLGLKLFENGDHKEVFNGPGTAIAQRFGHRAGFGEKQLSFSVVALAALSQGVRARDRVPRRALK